MVYSFWLSSAWIIYFAASLIWIRFLLITKNKRHEWAIKYRGTPGYREYQPPMSKDSRNNFMQ